MIDANDFFDIPTVKKVYQTLYARTETGAIQLWWMEQDGDKFRSMSGQQGGVIKVSEWTTATVKNKGRANATTTVAQATKEIEAKYKKQLEQGGYWEDVKDIDKEKFFQVMLAEKFADFKDGIDWKAGVAIQIKYNGGRIKADKNGLWTRKGKRYRQLPHIERALQPFFKKFPDAVLDGEGFNYELREKLNKIMRLMRKTVHFTPVDLAESEKLVKFYIYDGFNFPAEKDGPTVPITAGYVERKAAIDNAFFAPCFADRYKNVIGKVPTWIVHSEAELDTLYKKFLEDKQEGAILRILGVPYRMKRTKDLLKYKPRDDAEFRVLSVQDGVGKFANRVATFTCEPLDGKTYGDGTKTFNATFMGDEDQADEAWKNKANFVGQVVTLWYNGLTGYGKPNYARLNYDNYMNDKDDDENED
jgi:DNA ligase-1